MVIGLVVGMIYSRTPPPMSTPTPPLEVHEVLGRMPDGNLVVTGKVGGVLGVFQTNYELTYQVETMFDMEHTTKLLELVTKDSIKQREFLRDKATTAGWDRFTTGPWAGGKK